MTAVPADEGCAGTVELIERDIMVGDGTDYAWDGQTDGLGLPEIRNNDVEKGHADGSTGQHDFYNARVISLPVSIAPAVGETVTRAQLWQRWLDLKTAWAKQGDGTDLTLEHVEVGFTTQYRGRPNGCVLNDIEWRRGMNVLHVLLSFRCPDPTEY